MLSRLINFSAERVRIHGAYYVPFGAFGTINYIIPYFVWSHEASNDHLTLMLRMFSSIMCFTLVLTAQLRNSKYYQELQKGLLPFYWHITVLLALPLMSTYTLLISGFATTWLINSTISILILVLLVDWMSFIIMILLGLALGYVMYIFRTGHMEVYFIKENVFLSIYLNSCALMVGAFFLYQKEQIIKEVIDAKDKLETLNTELEEKVQKRTSFLKKALNAKTEFLNNISHEVRTPLQGITGISTELVAQWDSLSDVERFNYASTVASNGNRLISLVSDLLDLSKFDSGKMLFDMEITDVREVIASVIAEVKLFHLTKKIQTVFKDNPKLNCKLLADKARIAQVVRNIISNAIKFSERGKIIISINKIDISHWNKNHKHGLWVSVKDSGPGIPESELDVIFQPFTQSTRTKTKAGGSGLGLAISSEIIHAHHGKIWAYNNPKDKGSTFCFILPCNLNNKPSMAEGHGMALVADLETQESYTSFEKFISRKFGDNRKILLIDDERACLVSGSLILKSAGFEVLTAQGGAEALEHLKNNKFIIILLDLMMPDIYGIDLLAQIKQDKNFKKIPVILQTGASDTVEISKAFSLGVKAHISKPYNRIQMIKTIFEVINDNE